MLFLLYEDELSSFRTAAFHLEGTLQAKPELSVQLDAYGDDVAGKISNGQDRAKSKIPNHARQLEGSLSLKYMVTISLRYLDVESGALQNGICCSDCDIFFRRTQGARSPSLSLIHI